MIPSGHHVAVSDNEQIVFAEAPDGVRGARDRAGQQAYVDEVSAPTKQGPAMRLAGIPIESSSTWSATPSPPEASSGIAFFCQFPGTSPSDVPKFLDAEMVRVYEDTAA